MASAIILWLAVIGLTVIGAWCFWQDVAEWWNNRRRP